MKGYPRTFHYLMVLTLLALIASGLALAPNLLVFKWELDQITPFEGATRMKIAAAHVAAALGFIWFVGALWPVHMRSGMRRHKNRSSGFGIVAITVLLAATGVASFYLGDETWQKNNSAIHLGAGLLLVAASLLHRLIGRRIAARSHAQHPH